MSVKILLLSVSFLLISGCATRFLNPSFIELTNGEIMSCENGISYEVDAIYGIGWVYCEADNNHNHIEWKASEVANMWYCKDNHHFKIPLPNTLKNKSNVPFNPHC
ncbi:MAG: hypothetical protein HYW34_00440 [Candidatus Brennerbacteria bacterium]|nr:hypothetical protein [Candidatus Brennerbacteria bacterium]